MSKACIYCNSENTETHVLRIDQDEVTVVECHEYGDCGDYFVVPEDTQAAEHTPKKPMCVTKLEPALGRDGADEFQLYCCPACGYYTTEN